MLGTHDAVRDNIVCVLSSLHKETACDWVDITLLAIQAGLVRNLRRVCTTWELGVLIAACRESLATRD